MHSCLAHAKLEKVHTNFGMPHSVNYSHPVVEGLSWSILCIRRIRTNHAILQLQRGSFILGTFWNAYPVAVASIVTAVAGAGEQQTSGPLGRWSNTKLAMAKRSLTCSAAAIHRVCTVLMSVFAHTWECRRTPIITHSSACVPLLSSFALSTYTQMCMRTVLRRSTSALSRSHRCVFVNNETSRTKRRLKSKNSRAKRRTQNCHAQWKAALFRLLLCHLSADRLAGYPLEKQTCQWLCE